MDKLLSGMTSPAPQYTFEFWKDMSEEEDKTEEETVESAESTAPTQAQLYDDLRRIGQLEDQKFAIQQEIDERTERLRNAIPTLEKSSLLYQMLNAALKAPASSKRAPKKSTSKKPPRKRS